jgi:hypothetical protein
MLGEQGIESAGMIAVVGRRTMASMDGPRFDAEPRQVGEENLAFRAGVEEDPLVISGLDQSGKAPFRAQPGHVGDVVMDDGDPRS